MKKQYLILFYCSIIYQFAFSQWERTNGLPFYTVVSMAQKDSIIFAGALDSGVVATTDNGNHWCNMRNGITSTYINTVIVEGDEIYTGTGWGVYRSKNYGINWNHLCDSFHGIIFSLVKINNIICAGSYGSGVYLSNDDGASWKAVKNYLNLGHVYPIIKYNNKIFAGTMTEGGVYVSADNGSTWTAVSNGLPDPVTIRSFAVSGSRIYTGTNYGLFYTDNEGGNWYKIVEGNIAPFGIGPLAVVGDKIVFGTDAGIFITDQYGNWTTFTTGMDSVAVRSFTMNNQFLFAGTIENGVWKRSLSEISGLEITKKQNISIYPNPAHEYLFLEVPFDWLNSTFGLYNINGEKLVEKQLWQTEVQVDINFIPPGIYIVRITNQRKLNQYKLIILLICLNQVTLIRSVNGFGEVMTACCIRR